MGGTGSGGRDSEFEEIVQDFGEEHAAVLAAQAAHPSAHPIASDIAGDSETDGVDEEITDGEDGPTGAGGICPPLLDRGQGEQE